MIRLILITRIFETTVLDERLHNWAKVDIIKTITNVIGGYKIQNFDTI